MQNNQNSKKVIIAITVLSGLVVAVLILAALYMTAKAQNNAKDQEMAAEKMELYLRRVASSQYTEIEEKRQLEYDRELIERAKLRDDMIDNDISQLLTLVNPSNEVPEDWEARIVKIGRRSEIEDIYLDERAAAALELMLTACQDAGCRPIVISGYRTHEYQQELFDDKIQREIAGGASEELAEIYAANEVARPGTSEHELGLAVDIIDDYYRDLDIKQEWTDTQRWLINNCTDYGFILRYPNGTTETTGIIYEPWHYRYIGKQLAKEYEQSGQSTFEDFIAGR